MNVKPLIAGLLAASLLMLAEAHAEKRVALVIGNSNYRHVRPLPNPQNDATAVAALLRTSGFDVVEAHNNVSGNEMRRAFRNFSDMTRDSDIAVVYYAGHGIEVDGSNYLLPTDSVLERDLDVEDEAVSLERIVKILEPAKRLRLVILDACRDNPFVAKMKRTSATRSIGRGLARVEPQSSDTLIAFAAKAGSTADDGDGAHSPFTSALLKYIATPGLDLRLAFGRVRDDVLKTTRNRQEPFVYGSLGGTTVSLVPAMPVAVAAPAAATAAPDPNAVARGDYEYASKVGSIKAWDAFLAAYPTGFYADLARAQRDRIGAAKTEPAKTEPASTEAAKTAAVQPSALPEVRKPTLDPAEVAHRVHKELARLGCYSADINDSWGKASRRAMELFNRHARMRLDASAASTDTLDALRDKTERVCPLECRRGFVGGDSGRCERKPADSAARPERNKRDTASQSRQEKLRETSNQRPKAQPSSGGAKVVCGMNGCLNVGPGCRGDVQRSGRGDWAVVICGQ